MRDIIVRLWGGEWFGPKQLQFIIMYSKDFKAKIEQQRVDYLLGVTLLNTLGHWAGYNAIHLQSVIKVTWRGLVSETSSPNPLDVIIKLLS